jgi:hypothetical protein
MGTDWGGKVQETAQEAVPEPVEAAGIVQPAGTMGTFGLSQVSGVVAMVKARKANQAAGGLGRTSVMASTKLAMFAVTADKVYALAVKQKGRGWKVKDQIGVWNRPDLTIETTPGKITTKVVIDVGSTGEHFEVEATTAGGSGVNDRFLAAIA